MNELDSRLSDALKHTHRLVDSESARIAVYGSGKIAAFNQWLAIKITRAVGTMWCAYLFALLALVSLPAALASRNPVEIVQWVSTIFLQLVLLSIIIVGQNVSQEASDQRAEADHETLQVLHQINVTQLEILNAIKGRIEPDDGGAPRASS